jgi:two-component system nitrogen regulation response regulator GlnG
MKRAARGGRILVVDDDASVRSVVHEALSEGGHRVAGAATLEQALEALAHARFDLVLVDALQAPAGGDPSDRWAVVERVRKQAGYAPVVIFTAYREEDFTGYAERGFADLLLKPFDLDELLATVARHLPSHRPADRRQGTISRDMTDKDA